PQPIGKLVAKLPGVQLIGVAAEQKSVAPLQKGQQGTDLLIGPKNVGPGSCDHFIRTGQPAALTDPPEKLTAADPTRFVIRFEGAAVEIGVHRFRRKRGVRRQAAGSQAVIEKTNDAAKIKD